MSTSSEFSEQQPTPFQVTCTFMDGLVQDDVDSENTRAARERALAVALNAARELGNALPDVPPWMQGAIAAGAQAMAQVSTAPVTATQLAQAQMLASKRFIKECPPVPEGFPALPAVVDCHDHRRLELVVRVLRARLADPMATLPLFSLTDLLEAANEFAFAADDLDESAWHTLRRLASSGAMRRLAPLPETGALTTLGAEMPNFHRPIDFYMGQSALARRQGSRGAGFAPVLLLGPPGVGKTTFAQRLAATMTSPFTSLQFASASAGWILGGLDRAWSNGRPGRVYTTLQQSTVANPVLLLDEIDKAGGDQRYDPLGPLYELLEAGTARRFSDECAVVPIDASHVIWIATANDVERIPVPLLSRFVVFDIALPEACAMRQIVRTRHAEVCGTAPCEPLDDNVVDVLIALSPREVGQRLRDAMGRAALRAEASGSDRLRVEVEDIGSPRRGRACMGFRP